MKDALRELSVPAGSAPQKELRGSRPPEPGLSLITLVAFIVGSFLAHGVAYAALSSLSVSASSEPRFASQEVAFTVVEAPADRSVAEPAAAMLERRPAAEPSPRRRTPARVPAPPTAQPQAPSVETASAPAPVQSLHVSEQAGVVTAGRLGPDSPSTAGSLTGVHGGTAAGSVAAPTPGAQVDLRKLTSAWASQVSQAINARASRAYPRTALRAHVQGSVLLSVRIGPTGNIEAVDIARSSGSAQLDEAAVAAARALGEVPAPPAALHRYLRPFPVPVNYTLR